jgi:hypothetical protein
MTEAEWMGCADPAPMLDFLCGKVSDRKLRLLICSWSRLNWKWLPEQCRSAVEVAELFADGLASDADRRSADGELWWTTQGRHNNFRHWQVRLALEGSRDLWPAAHGAASRNPTARNGQIAMLHEIMGSPCRPSPPLPRSVLAWNDGTVRRNAEGIYDEWAFDRLPILADALLDAGCDNEDLIQHCCGAGPHVRGCWAVDLILGKS